MVDYMESIELEKIDYKITETHKAISIRTEFKINLIEDGEKGWVWLDIDYYQDYGIDVILTGFWSKTINLFTDKKVCANLTYLNPYDIESPQLQKCLLVKNG